MEAILGRLRGLSADELREEFLKADLKCGPITATTRAIFERKLARAILGANANVAETDGGATAAASISVGMDGDATGATSMPLEPTACEEGDFGYGLGLNPPEEEELSEKSRAACCVSKEWVGTRPDAQTPTKSAQVSPTSFYGVCPLWEDVLVRSERVNVYTDKKEALQAVKTMKGARFKAFSNREDAEKFAKGMCDYYPSPSKSALCVSPVKAGLTLGKDAASLLEAETVNRERANSFKSPRTQDLTAKLRKAVEKGDEVVFSELVWSNPRYLIGSGDNPTVVQEGCRYNVMHVAAKENQPRIAQLLLDTLENPDFMRLMYPDDQDAMLQKRIRYIVDLYLNTPDKAGFETPLHFACKFGCSEVVNVLCTHPDIDKNCKNKYDQRPCDVICERMKEKCKTEDVKQKICEYLEDRFYIPLLRPTDNSSQPLIGAPWSPEPVENLSPRLPRSPMDPLLVVRAFAGPLSPSKAEDFRRAWKTPPRDRIEHVHHILKSDPDRGVERVGRELAHKLGHPWAEYWDFLDSFVDLSSSEGLRKLEEYLSKKDFSERSHEETGENETRNRFRTPSPGKPKKFCNSISVGAFLDEDDDISLEEIKNRQNAALTSISAICAKDSLKGAVGGLEFHILPVSHTDDLIETAAEQGLLRPEKAVFSSASKNGLCPQNGDKASPRVSASSCLLSPISNLMVEFERMSLFDEADGSPRERRRSGEGRIRDSRDGHAGENLASGVTRLTLASSDESIFGRGCSVSRDTGLRMPPDVEVQEGRSSTDSEEYSLAEESLEALAQRTRAPGAERTLCARSKSWDHGGRDLSSSGSSSSYRSLDGSQEDPSPFIIRTRPRVRKGLFIEGDSPTKLDKEVLSAIEAIDIDHLKYPSIHKWKSTIQTYPSSEMQRWPTPAGARHLRVGAHMPGSPLGALTSPAGRYSPARHAPSPDCVSPSRYSPAHLSYIQRLRIRQFSDPTHLTH